MCHHFPPYHVWAHIDLSGIHTGNIRNDRQKTVIYTALLQLGQNLEVLLEFGLCQCFHWKFFCAMFYNLVIKCHSRLQFGIKAPGEILQQNLLGAFKIIWILVYMNTSISAHHQKLGTGGA